MLKIFSLLIPRIGQAQIHSECITMAPPPGTANPIYSKFTGYGNLNMASIANSMAYDLYRDVTGKFRDLP
jgi:hypothetical protein